MDAKDIQSDLCALKRLYGLLRDGSSKPDSDFLDEHSRLVLQNLLDAATKRALLKLQLEVVAGPLEESQGCEQGKDTDKDAKMDGLDVTTLWNENRHAGGVPAQKRCRVCQRSTIKQLESMHFDDDDGVALNSSNTFADLQKNESDRRLWNSDQEIKLNNEKSGQSKSDKGRKQGGSYVSSNLDGAKMCNYDDIESTSNKPDCLSKEASEAMKQIELCISAIHRGGADQQLQQLFEKNYYCVPEIKSSDMPKQYVGENNFMSTSNFLSSQRVVNPIGFPMYCWLPTNQPYLSLSQTCKLFEPTKAMLRQSSTNNNVIRRGGEPALEGDMSSESRDQCKFPTTKKKTYGQNVKATLDKIESGKWKMSPDQHGTFLQNKDGTSRNRARLQHQESESTDTGSYQQSSSSRDIDSEEYSFTDKTGELQYMRSSSRSSGSWGGSTGVQYSSSYTSNSEEEVYSSSSSGDGAPQMTSTRSNYSKSEGSTPKKSGPSRIHRSYGINHKKQFGVWERLKDRLAIVFHHHRRHHDGHHTNDEAKMSRKTSLGKRPGKVVNFKRQDGEMAVEKMKKSVVHEKKQHSHFHGLVRGVLRHVGHSKQSKAGKGKDKRHGRNKTLNKSHWWQLLQHHHRGAKFPNTTHGKLGMGKEKARLKALPNIK